MMLKEGIGGFCMALADSVPGVSGGTVAFIMGFYDRFIGSIHDFVFGNMDKKKEALKFLVKLGIGWLAGMILAVLILSSLFESHIYVVSSLFIGFIAGSIHLIIREEKDSFKEMGKGILFCLLGIVIVVGITWLNGKMGNASMNLGQFSIGMGIKLFLIGMVAISAMFLPGISGSTLLLIFGAYLPVISAVRGVLGMDLSYVPGLAFFGVGVLTGCYCSEGNTDLSGKIQTSGSLYDFRNDARFFLCNSSGTNYFGFPAESNESGNFSFSGFFSWCCIGGRNASVFTEVGEKQK